MDSFHVRPLRTSPACRIYITADQPGKFRDECLNEQWFQTLHQARGVIADWRRDFNEVRPHSSLGRIPPAQFAEQHRREQLTLNPGLLP